MFNPMMSLLVFSLLIIPTLLTGKINEQFLKTTLGFVVSIFSSTFILFLILIVVSLFHLFIF